MKPTVLRKALFVMMVFLLVGAFTLFPATPAYAAGMVVNTASDTTANDGDCSLREAISNANGNNRGYSDCPKGNGQDQITFAPGVSTIMLSSSLPNISDSAGLIIDGAGVVTINGGGYRVFAVNANTGLILNGLTITNGNAGTNYGGAIYNQGILAVNNSSFISNTAQFGGAILSMGGVTAINNSTFLNNRGLEGGGAVLFTSSGTHWVINSLFADNVAYNASNGHGSGAGIQTENGTTVNITNVTLVNNNAGGNADDGGGGLMVYGGTVTVVNSTFSNNASATHGGGIRQLGGTATLRNTIVASSSSGGNCYGTVTDGTGNLVWGDTSCPGVNQDPQLQALANNGGPSNTMALGAGSAAINLAKPGYCPFTDQRGFTRRSGFCDSGAFEAQPAAVTAASGTPQQTLTNHPFANPLVASVADAFNNLLGGVVVIFASPSSGASATLSSTTAKSDLSGSAAVTATANNVVGSYVVTASVSGISGQATFSLANTAPKVISIVRAGSNPSNAASVPFTVTFDTSMTGVDGPDFVLSVSGISGASVSSVSGSGTTYTVLVNTGSGDGTLRLDLVDDDTIVDSYGQPLGGPGTGNGNYSSGEVYTIDKTPPETNLTGTPSDPTNQTDASFSFSSPDGSATFECALDGASFTGCTSPAGYTALAEGEHTFQVRAKDEAGNVDPTPASFTWVIDVTPPETNLTGTPSDPTNQTDASFSFSSPDGSATFECALDWASFTGCTSPAGYTALAEGEHTFQVRAKDEAGNVDPTPASFTWTIDLTALSIDITSHPDDPTVQTAASFTFTISDGNGSGVKTVVCSLDSDLPVACDTGHFDATVGEGSHTFHVTAQDNAGNQTAISYTWLVDLTNPTASLGGLSAWQTSLNFTVSWSGNDDLSGLDHYTVQVKQGAGEWSDWQANTTQTSAVFTGLDGAAYTFRVRAVDKAGNVGDWSNEQSTTVDGTAPVASLDGLPPLTFGAFLVSWSGNDATSGIASYDVEFQVDGGSWQSWFSATTQTSAMFTPTAGQAYSFRVRAVDVAGNVGAWSSVVSTRSGGKLFIPLISFKY